MTDREHSAEEADPGPSRRAFLLGAAGVTGVAAVAAWRPAAADAAPSSTPAANGNGNGTEKAKPDVFGLRLDDVNVGLIEKFEGGETEGIVVVEPPSPDGSAMQKKHLGGVKYNEFSVQMGLSMGEPVRKWIESSLQMNFLRKSGELQAADFKRDIRQVREFRDALITEVGFPGADGAAKDPAYMTLKFAPEITRNKKGSGKVENPVDVKQKQWLPSNFRLTIDGLEKACAKISKVDAITIKQTTAVADTEPGTTVPGAREPGKIDFPNVTVTVAEADSKPFFDWHEDFVVNGNNDDAHERNGKLEYLDSDRKTVMLTLTFKNMGIFKGTAEASENNADKIRRVKFDLYLENVVAKFGG